MSQAPLKPVTMKQIADMAGVSRPAVSAVLNDRLDSSIKVSREKREKILELARSLKYRPNFAAIQLNGKRDKSIGVIHGCYTTGTNSEMLRLLSIKLRVEGYQGYFVGITDPKHELDTINDFISRGMDGIISYYTLNDIRQADYPIPMVCIEASIHNDFDVSSDQHSGFYTATSHLLRHGHRKIGLLCAIALPNIHKIKGYQQALRDAGIEPREDWIISLTWNKDFLRVIENLLADGVRAFVCSGDMLAGKFIAWLNDRGYRVPEDVAVFGNDGLEVANITPVPLSTIVHPLSKLADRTVELLINKVGEQRTGREKKPTIIKPGYRLSRSCGCPLHDRKLIHWEWMPITLESASQNLKPPPPELAEKSGILTEDELLNKILR